MSMELFTKCFICLGVLSFVLYLCFRHFRKQKQNQPCLTLEQLKNRTAEMNEIAKQKLDIANDLAVRNEAAEILQKIKEKLSNAQGEQIINQILVASYDEDVLMCVENMIKDAFGKHIHRRTFGYGTGVDYIFAITEEGKHYDRNITFPKDRISIYGSSCDDRVGRG